MGAEVFPAPITATQPWQWTTPRFIAEGIKVGSLTAAWADVSGRPPTGTAPANSTGEVVCSYGFYGVEAQAVTVNLRNYIYVGTTPGGSGSGAKSVLVFEGTLDLGANWNRISPNIEVSPWGGGATPWEQSLVLPTYGYHRIRLRCKTIGATCWYEMAASSGGGVQPILGSTTPPEPIDVLTAVQALNGFNTALVRPGYSNARLVLRQGAWTSATLKFEGMAYGGSTWFPLAGLPDSGGAKINAPSVTAGSYGWTFQEVEGLVTYRCQLTAVAPAGQTVTTDTTTAP